MYKKLCSLALSNTTRGSVLHRIARRLHPAVDVTYDGWIMRLHPYDNFTEYHMALAGTPPEIETYRYLRREIAGKTIDFIDVGANCGIYSIPASVLSRQGSRIFSFEPNPVMIGRLKQNIVLNKSANIAVFQSAVGPSHGEMSLHIPKARFREMGRASIIRPSGAFDSVKVEVVPLASVIPKRQPSTDLRILKADVEGYEDRALSEFIKHADKENLPDQLIVETAHSDHWQTELIGIIQSRTFNPVATIEGNTIFTRIDGRCS